VEAAAPGIAPLRLRKLRNLVLNERERLSQVETVTSLPITGQIDPAFQCNLQCPHCLSDMIRQDGYSLPLMKPGQLDAVLDKYGDALVRIWLSLWGEPLLNKNLAAMIERCKRHDIWVLISSNMSVPLTDAAVEGLVRSGLDSIVLSVDGATQATYETYRRNGDLGLVLANAERLVRAKRRLGSATPYLYWRFLTFPWNEHEAEAARALAARIGVDEFGVEPGVLTPQVRHSREKRPEAEAPRQQDPAIQENWRRISRKRTLGHRYFGCDCLYSSISVNADGMVHPCCYVVSPAHAVGDAGSSADALRNHPVMRASRQLFARIGAGDATPPQGHDPCLSCPVVADTGGHVVTQTGFRQAYDYLLRGIPMGW
jgi:MoaA/NifB/PqqE/SkfB family radical SAM enzyme